MTAFVGRQQERHVLRAALEERAPRLFVVRGPSGVGKTALVEQALRDVATMDPIVGRAKYAEQATSAGLRPVVDALSQAVDAALGRLYDPMAGAASLRTLLGQQYDTLLAAGFEAAGLAASTSPGATVPLQSREGTVRLVDALVRVLQWLEGFALPVVLFIDDWHRAPNEAVGFVHACSRRGDGSALKLVLAQRSEGAMAYPAAASIVELEPLGGAQRLELLTSLLEEPARARAVMEWLGDQASGLPFDLSEIALAFGRHQQAFIGAGDELRVDPTRAATIDHRNINTIIVQRARTLPPTTVRLGIAAALWGDRAPLDVLGRCLGDSQAVTQDAAEALESNGLLRIEGNDIAFPHDRIRSGLLRVPSHEELGRLAHVLADALLGESMSLYRETALKLKLTGGLDGVRDPGLVALFAAGGAAARDAAQFDLAAAFGEAAWTIGQQLNDGAGGGRSIARLAMLREACFAAAHRRQTEATRERTRLLIAAASDGAELADAYEHSVIAMRLAGTRADAWALCLEGFARFGVHLPHRVTRLHLIVAMIVWKLIGRKPRRLFRHDPKTEEAITSLVSSTTHNIWEHEPRFAAYLALRMAIRARVRGYDSALWLSADAVIASAMNDYFSAAAYGNRAIAKLPMLKTGRSITLHRAITFGKQWREPRASLLDAHREIYELCIAESNLMGAANAVLNEVIWSWRTARTLKEVAAKLSEVGTKVERLGNDKIREEITRLAEFVQRLRQPYPLSASLPAKYTQAIFGELPIIIIEYLSLADDWPAILHITTEVRARRRTFELHPVVVSWRFYQNLARLKAGLRLIRQDLKLVERAARANPTDQLGRLLLLRAEELYRRRDLECLAAYSAAIEAMRKGSSRLELGLAAECAAAAARDLGDRTAHERFQAVATETWSAWGAFGKLAMYDARQLDASVRAQLAEAEAQAAMARRSEQAKSRFLAEVGHELRTPLQAMQGLLDLAAERPAEIDLVQMREVFGSLKAVVDDLTELGALSADAPLNTRSTDLTALLTSELALMQGAAREKGIALSAVLSAFDGHIFDVDPDRVRQAVRNLLSNAVKYTESGIVVLRATLREDADGPAKIALTVEDSGPGIPDERLPHLFEPFDRAGRKDSQGLGLGLSLSRRIAERMGGTLTAENRAEGGARFVFSFTATRRPIPQSPVAPQAAPRPLTILIVEDTTLVRRLLVRLLALDGHKVLEAENLEQALDQVTRHGLDLLLLDLQLPDGNGLSLLDRWPGDRARPAIIVLTAAVTRDTESQVRQAGATVLRKPISAADLRAAIAGLCGTTAMTAINADVEMAKLAKDARLEIAKRRLELIDLVRSDGPLVDIQRQAHMLAGLAAQFDAPHVATAADRIEQACATARSPREGLAELEAVAAGP